MRLAFAALMLIATLYVSGCGDHGNSRSQNVLPPGVFATGVTNAATKFTLFIENTTQFPLHPDILNVSPSSATITIPADITIPVGGTYRLPLDFVPQQFTVVGSIVVPPPAGFSYAPRTFTQGTDYPMNATQFSVNFY